MEPAIRNKKNQTNRNNEKPLSDPTRPTTPRTSLVQKCPRFFLDRTWLDDGTLSAGSLGHRKSKLKPVKNAKPF
jgi:hypothetical protein